MDDFIYVLATAFVVMVFLIMVSALGPWVSPGDYQTQVINFSVGKIGVINDIPTRTDPFGSFVIGEEQSQELKNVPQFMVGASWLGANVQKYEISVPEWYLEDMKNARLSFNVHETNQYGNLVIVWNGFRVKKDILGTGNHEIIIEPNLVKENNVLRVYAEGPGPRFWASTTYVLRDFSVNIDYGPKRLIPFQTLRSELESFSRGELTFYASDNPSRLEIKVNGIEIYDQIPSGFGSAEFDFVTVPLNSGTNIVSFSSSGRVNLHDVNLNLFLLTNEVIRVRRFNITQEQYTMFDYGYSGRIEFKIDNVLREGNINIVLNDRTIRVYDYDEGWNDVRFTKEDVNIGENEISFSGTGGFYIDEAAVLIGP